MNKQGIAKLFVESFNTDIAQVITSGNLEGSGHPSNNSGEVIFKNYASYHKGDFTRDFNAFIKKISKIYGIDEHALKKTGNTYKSFYYKWDAEQIMTIEDVKFVMGRRMMNMPHAILDGVSQIFYIDIFDTELIEEINKLYQEQLAQKEQKRQEELPAKKKNAIKECNEMIALLTQFVDGTKELTDDAMMRIHNAHFQTCVMIGE